MIEITIKQVVAALLDNNKPFPPTYLHRFSDLSQEDLSEIKKAWPSVDTRRKTNLMEDLEDLSESETLVDFSDFSRQLIEDPIPSVRACAIRLLWETADNRLIPSFLKIMDRDQDDIVRATAATALGQFIYLGEMEELAPAALSRVEDALLKKVASSDHPLVRRRALGSLGFSSRHEVVPLIKRYFNSDQSDWVASALFAMGRSADPQWDRAIKQSLSSPEPDIQLEAVRAAGSLELADTRENLIELLEEAEELDDELRMAVIWSLSQIGGEGVHEVLDRLYEECEDDEELELLEQALDNLGFYEGLDSLDILTIEPQSKEDLNMVIDLENDEEEDHDDTSSKKTRKRHPKSKP